MELKITKDKVLAAAAKCSTAKATLETLFPECFEKEGLPLRLSQGQKIVFAKEFNSQYVKVPLPNSNNEWSVEAFEWAIKFISKNNAYIEHSEKFDYRYLYINCR